jgi:hypothetical protein
MRQARPNIIVVKRETRLEGLKARWVSPTMAQFVLKDAHAHAQERGRQSGKASAQVLRAQAAAGFDEYADEDEVYRTRVAEVHSAVQVGLPTRILDRSLVPTFDFWSTAVVVVVGQDGLVANTAKYVGDIPIVGVNPDPRRIDGVLLPFTPADVRAAVQRVLDGRFSSRRITLAEVHLGDGQRLLAFNDLFIGASSHISARYTLAIQGKAEAQSSSGVLVSTGAGSTGWMSSVFNMAAGLARAGGQPPPAAPALRWEDRRLAWMVREPFRSRQTGADLVAGMVQDGEELVLESLMPQRGVIFSDGIEADFLEFNSGTIARVRVSGQSARLVTPRDTPETARPHLHSDEP